MMVDFETLDFYLTLSGLIDLEFFLLRLSISQLVACNCKLVVSLEPVTEMAGLWRKLELDIVKCLSGRMIYSCHQK